jgi:hypothetical protein
MARASMPDRIDARISNECCERGTAGDVAEALLPRPPEGETSSEVDAENPLAMSAASPTALPSIVGTLPSRGRRTLTRASKRKGGPCWTATNPCDTQCVAVGAGARLCSWANRLWENPTRRPT